jgi:hypothetical protein
MSGTPTSGCGSAHIFRRKNMRLPLWTKIIRCICKGHFLDAVLFSCTDPVACFHKRSPGTSSIYKHYFDMKEGHKNELTNSICVPHTYPATAIISRNNITSVQQQQQLCPVATAAVFNTVVSSRYVSRFQQQQQMEFSSRSSRVQHNVRSVSSYNSISIPQQHQLRPATISAASSNNISCVQPKKISLSPATTSAVSKAIVSSIITSNSVQ